MVSIEEITKLGNLARIKLADDEKQALANDLQVILDYFNELKSLNIEEINDGEFFLAVEKVNEFRDDDNAYESGKFSEKILEQAPDKEDGYIKVKKIL